MAFTFLRCTKALSEIMKKKNVGVYSIYAFVCVWFEIGTTGVERERISSGIGAFITTGVEREISDSV